MRKPNPKNALPEWCFAYIPTDEDGMVIKIRRGERGYCMTDLTGGKSMAIALNTEYNISIGQMEAMIIGSMFGWTVAGAYAAIYSKTGKIIVKSLSRYRRGYEGETKMKSATIRNTFHNTSTTIRVPAELAGITDESEIFYELDMDAQRELDHQPTRYWANPVAVQRRVSSALCGIQSCMCGNMIRHGQK